jgi:NADH-quinone oxidoreductase subunit J
VVLFLFVIMLLGVDRAEDLRTDPITVQRPLAVVMGIGLLVFLAGSIAASTDSLGPRGPGIATAAITGDPDTDVRALARSIFSDYVVAFEVTSVLLVIAVVGTVVLARRTKEVAS